MVEAKKSVEEYLENKPNAVSTFKSLVSIYIDTYVYKHFYYEVDKIKY